MINILMSIKTRLCRRAMLTYFRYRRGVGVPAFYSQKQQGRDEMRKSEGENERRGRWKKRI